MTADDLESSRLTRELERCGVALGNPLTVLTTTASTNDDAKRAGQQGARGGAAFLADAQTAGRGRLGRKWHSPPGENLYVSFLLRHDLGPTTAPLLTLAAGLAVRDALAPLVPAHTVAIKWPNDIYIDGRKVAGILAEAQLAAGTTFAVLGIGVNVRAAAFPAELAPRATSLALAGAATLDRGAVFVAIAGALEVRLAELGRGSVQNLIADFGRHDALFGRPISVEGEEAVALGLASDGGLRIRRQDGSEGVIVAGDVQPRAVDVPA